MNRDSSFIMPFLINSGVPAQVPLCGIIAWSERSLNSGMRTSCSCTWVVPDIADIYCWLPAHRTAGNLHALIGVRGWKPTLYRCAIYIRYVTTIFTKKVFWGTDQAQAQQRISSGGEHSSERGNVGDWALESLESR